MAEIYNAYCFRKVSPLDQIVKPSVIYKNVDSPPSHRAIKNSLKSIRTYGRTILETNASDCRNGCNQQKVSSGNQNSESVSNDKVIQEEKSIFQKEIKSPDVEAQEQYVQQDEQIDSEYPSQDLGDILKTQIQYHYQEGQSENYNEEDQPDARDADSYHSEEGEQSETMKIEQDSAKFQSINLKQISQSSKIEEPKNHSRSSRNKSSRKKSSNKKLKKFYKCMLCKGVGRKGQMKNCNKCKSYIHKICLELQEDLIPSKYVCQKCNFDPNSVNVNILKIRKCTAQVINLDQSDKSCDKEDLSDTSLDEINLATITNRICIQKLKKRGGNNPKEEKTKKSMRQFTERYPFYVQRNKIKFPIDDRLLVLYPELCQVDDRRKVEPKNHPSIPSEFLGDMLQIENWLMTFQPLLIENFPNLPLPNKLKKDEIFFNLNCQGIDQTFQQLYGTFMRLYLADIFQASRKENIRMLNDNSFFSLLTIMNQAKQLTNEFLVQAGQQIIIRLASVPSVKRGLQRFTYPDIFSCQTKVKLLIDLIRGLTEVYSFHLLANKKTEKIQQMIERKGRLISQIKMAETGKLYNRQKIKNNVQDLQQFEEEDSFDKTKKKAKSRDKKKKDIQPLSYENKLTEGKLQNAKQMLSECMRGLHFATSDVIFLGRDRNRSEYFFVKYQPWRIYIRYRDYFFDPTPNYKIYQGKLTMIELIRSLSVKGINQKKLHHNLLSLNKLELIDHNRNNKECIQRSAPKVWHFENTHQSIVEFFLNVEQELNEFFKQRNYQRVNDDQRKVQIKNLRQEKDIINLREKICTIQESFLTVDIMEGQPKISTKKGQVVIYENETKFNPKRKAQLKIWGPNQDKIKKYWIDYVSNATNFSALWIGTYILRDFILKFMRKKIQLEAQQKKKQQKIQHQRQEQLKIEAQKQTERQKLLKKVIVQSRNKMQNKIKDIGKDDDSEERSQKRFRTRSIKKQKKDELQFQQKNSEKIQSKKRLKKILVTKEKPINEIKDEQKGPSLRTRKRKVSQSPDKIDKIQQKNVSRSKQIIEKDQKDSIKKISEQIPVIKQKDSRKRRGTLKKGSRTESQQISSDKRRISEEAKNKITPEIMKTKKNIKKKKIQKKLRIKKKNDSQSESKQDNKEKIQRLQSSEKLMDDYQSEIPIVRRGKRLKKAQKSDQKKQFENKSKQGQIKQTCPLCSSSENSTLFIDCSTCKVSYHMDCVKMVRMPRGEWSCSLCKPEQLPKTSRRGRKL